jgi:hypothetical protein
MSIASRQSVCRILLIMFVCLAVSKVQAQAPVTELDRQLARVSLGVVGVGMITGDVSGTIINNPTVQSLSTSSTVGALATLRYVKSPLVGFEFNYSYSRYTENFSNFFALPGCGSISCATPGGVQTRANEYTLGYVAHLPTFLGVVPFASVGLGSTGFTPTAGGGQGLKAQARATYYYSIGVEQSLLSKHFGIRAEFRQVFFKAPDFGQNYLTINQHTSTYEPGAGFFLRF